MKKAKIILAATAVFSASVSGAATKASKSNSSSASVSVESSQRKAAPSQSATRTPASSGSVVATSGQSSFREWAKGKLSVGVSADTVTTGAAQDVSINVDGADKIKGGTDINTSGVLALTANLSVPVPSPKIPVNGLVGLRVENNRELDSVSGAVRAGLQGKSTLQPWIAHAGAAYQINPMWSLPVALNYTVFNQVKAAGVFKELSANPEIGYQFGVAVRPAANFEIELLQKETRYNINGKGDGFKAEFGTVKFTGLALSGRYVF